MGEEQREERYDCSFCTARNFTFDELQAHVRLVHRELIANDYAPVRASESMEECARSGGFDCMFCDLCGVTEAELNIHIHSVHLTESSEHSSIDSEENRSVGEQDKEVGASSSTESHDSLNTSAALTASEVEQPSSEMFNYVGIYGSNSNHSMDVPMDSASGGLITSGTGGNVFTCPICDITFTIARQLTYHVERHFEQSIQVSQVVSGGNGRGSQTNKHVSAEAVIESQRQQLEERKKKMKMSEEHSSYWSYIPFIHSGSAPSASNGTNKSAVSDRSGSNDDKENIKNGSNKSGNTGKGSTGNGSASNGSIVSGNTGSEACRGSDIKSAANDQSPVVNGAGTDLPDWIFDNLSSCTKDVTQALHAYYSRYNPRHKRYWLASTTDHFSTFAQPDKGFGCGYRNLQMILSCLAHSPLYQTPVFSGLVRIPSVPRIQRLIESAWRKGFDRVGAAQLSYQVFGTRKWIGATEIVTILSSLYVRCHLVDFHAPSDAKTGTHPRLFSWVRRYFESRRNAFCPPLYLQHQGHARLIVGYEELREADPTSAQLIIIDPGCPRQQMQKIFDDESMKATAESLTFPLHSLKRKQYQIVAVLGLLQNDQQYEESKRLHSEQL